MAWREVPARGAGSEAAEGDSNAHEGLSVGVTLPESLVPEGRGSVASHSLLNARDFPLRPARSLFR